MKQILAQISHFAFFFIGILTACLAFKGVSTWIISGIGLLAGVLSRQIYEKIYNNQ